MSVPGEEADPSQGEEETPAEGEEPAAEGADDGAAEPEPKLTRKERRAALEAAREENQRLTASIAEERQRREALEASVSEMRGYLSAQEQERQRQQQQGGANELHSRIDALEEEAQRHLAIAQSTKSPEIAKAEFKEFQRLGREAAKLETRAEIMGEFQRERANQPDPEVMRIGTQMEVEYPWLRTNKVAAAAAGALEQQMLSEGKPYGVTTTRAAAAEIAKRFGLGGHAPGAPNRSAYGGVPSRESSPGQGGEGRVMVNPASLEKWQRDLAEKTFPTMEPKAAHKAWASKMNAHFKANPEG